MPLPTFLHKWVVIWHAFHLQQVAVAAAESDRREHPLSELRSIVLGRGAGARCPKQDDARENPAAFVSVVVSDTSPLHYLILCGLDAVLARLFERVVIPPTVFAELQHPNTPRWCRSGSDRCPPGSPCKSPTRSTPLYLYHRREPYIRYNRLTDRCLLSG